MKLFTENFAPVTANCKGKSCTECGRPVVGEGIKCEYYKNGGAVAMGVYHYKCYKPPMPMMIKRDKSRVGACDETFVSSWNQQFKLPSITSYLQPKVNAGELRCVRLRRVWLEVFKFFTLEELVLKLSPVCKDFYLLCWAAELWIQDGVIGDVIAHKTEAIKKRKYSCISCGNRNERELVICCIMKKPLCRVCRNNPHNARGDMTYFLRDLYWLMSVYNVNSAIFDRHHIPLVYDMYGGVRTYEFLLVDAIDKEQLQPPVHIMTTRSKRLKRDEA
jgi:hypothetical protein